MPRNYAAELNNPCLQEQDLSYKCLNKNHFDKEKCEVFFVNYNNCKEFWNRVKGDRRVKGIEPQLPPPEERARIKAEYMATKPLPS